MSASNAKTVSETPTDWKKKYLSKVKDCEKLITAMKQLQHLCKKLQTENERMTKELKSYQKDEASNNDKNEESEATNRATESGIASEKANENNAVTTSKQSLKKEKNGNDKALTEFVGIVGAGDRGIYLATTLKHSGKYNVLLIDINRDMLKRAQMTIKTKEKALKLTDNSNVGKIHYLTDLKQMANYRVSFVIETICERIDLKKRCFAEIFSHVLTRAKQDASILESEKEKEKEKETEKESNTNNTNNNDKNGESKDDTKENNKTEKDKKIELNCIMASVSSMWSISELASILPNEYQSNVIGLNFVNNENDGSKYIEIRPCWQSSAQTVANTKKFIASIVNVYDNSKNENEKNICQMSYVTVGDSPGSVKFRLLAVIINEAFCLLQEKMCRAQDIDCIMSEAMKSADNETNVKNMGPLAIADSIGLDNVLGMLNVLHADFGNAKYCPNFLLKQYVRCGRLGRKTKVGVYVYH